MASSTEKAPSNSSSSLRSNVDYHRHHQGHGEEAALTESELIAAKQLMQLSDDNISSNSSGIDDIKNKKKKKKRTRNSETEDEEYESPMMSVITCAAMIEEIFGKEHDDDDLRRGIKKQKYRSLARIYRTTKPTGQIIKMNNATTASHCHRRRSYRA